MLHPWPAPAVSELLAGRGGARVHPHAEEEARGRGILVALPSSRRFGNFALAGSPSFGKAGPPRRSASHVSCSGREGEYCPLYDQDIGVATGSSSVTTSHSRKTIALHEAKRH
ncbi:MAG TPA: hypothetical protein VFV38_29560 [Ktedonobacteraceae bacterium]|nr:hypothetical protein [Ktedonobacteraceae bacterium]